VYPVLWISNRLQSNGYSYEVAPDGKRFLIVSPAGEEQPSRAVVVTKWVTAVKP